MFYHKNQPCCHCCWIWNSKWKTLLVDQEFLGRQLGRWRLRQDCARKNSLWNCTKLCPDWMFQNRICFTSPTSSTSGPYSSKSNLWHKQIVRKLQHHWKLHIDHNWYVFEIHKIYWLPEKFVRLNQTVTTDWLMKIRDVTCWSNWRKMFESHKK